MADQRGDHAITDPGSSFRDAYCAAAFATLCEAEQVRLIDADRPDFEIKRDGQWQAYEVTEADRAVRRRGDEFKAERQAKVKPRFLRDDEWLTPEKAEIMLHDAAEKKTKKGYDLGMGLLIYLNPGEFGIYQRPMECLMPHATDVARLHFKEVWVLWKGAAYNLWYDGKLSGVVLRWGR